MRYAAKWPVYAKMWDAMVIKTARQAEFDRIAQYAIEHKPRYLLIAAATGVPWHLIAVLHRRESDADFNTYLGNGDRLSRPTSNVPRGRGPFTGPHAFEDGAKDALHLDGLDSVKDWRLEKELYHAELFNGTGYDMRHLPSPYLWGGTNQQALGKFIADGHFSASALDGQPGIAPMLATMARLDPTISFVRES